MAYALIILLWNELIISIFVAIASSNSILTRHSAVFLTISVKNRKGDSWTESLMKEAASSFDKEASKPKLALPCMPGPHYGSQGNGTEAGSTTSENMRFSKRPNSDPPSPVLPLPQLWQLAPNTTSNTTGHRKKGWPCHLETFGQSSAHTFSCQRAGRLDISDLFRTLLLSLPLSMNLAVIIKQSRPL
jgi:hypothetical protein